MKKLVIYFPCTATLSNFKKQNKISWEPSSQTTASLSGHFSPKEIQMAVQRYGAFIIYESGPKASEKFMLL